MHLPAARTAPPPPLALRSLQESLCPSRFVGRSGLSTDASAPRSYAGGLSMGPLSLMGCIFSLLLVFNMIFARWLLKEELTAAKVNPPPPSR